MLESDWLSLADLELRLDLPISAAATMPSMTTNTTRVSILIFCLCEVWDDGEHAAIYTRLHVCIVSCKKNAVNHYIIPCYFPSVHAIKRGQKRAH